MEPIGIQVGVKGPASAEQLQLLLLESFALRANPMTKALAGLYGDALHVHRASKLAGGDRYNLVTVCLKGESPARVFGDLLRREVFAVGVVLNGKPRAEMGDVGNDCFLANNGACGTAWA